MTRPRDELGTLRRDIDALDRELVALLRRRVRASVRVAAVKDRLGLPRRDAAREREVTRRAVALGKPPLDARAIRRLFRLLMEECRRLAWAGGPGARPRQKRSLTSARSFRSR